MTNNCVDTQEYFIEEAIKAAKHLQREVMERNHIKSEPDVFTDLVPIPVFESDGFSLLQHTNEIGGEDMHTEILWPRLPNYDHLAAIFKRYVSTSQIGGKTAVITKNEIAINESENYCFARLLAAKELMHVHLCVPEDAATTSAKDAEQLIQELILRTNPNGDAKQTMADIAAWFGAVEFLLPQSWKPCLKQAHAELIRALPNEQDMACFYLAQVVRVPESLVRFHVES